MIIVFLCGNLRGEHLNPAFDLQRQTPPTATVMSLSLEMGSGICHQMRDRIKKWKIVTPDDPDQDNGTILLNYLIAIVPGQMIKISN
ncbi:hypothetical protein TNCV_4440501 [Trichonephila clavipes]|nr:hypothetical protein TNCV_4440501 [Trichonephila clavipes]